MIGGNTTARLQHYVNIGINGVGERVASWETSMMISGFLDLVSGEAKYTYNAKLQESTHIFICDYVKLDKAVDKQRMLIGGYIYDILLIDDPMGMHQHLEIYLRYVGR